MNKIPKEINAKVQYFLGAMDNLRKAQKTVERRHKSLKTAEAELEHQKKHAEQALAQVKEACSQAWDETPFETKRSGVLHPWALIKNDLINKIKRS